MTKLFKYLKPYALAVLLILLLLIGQAFSELSLPNYTADIVDTGIQQGGMTSVVPDALPSDLPQQAALLLSPEDASLLTSAYVPETPGVTDGSVSRLKPRAGGNDTAAWLFLRDDADTTALTAPMTRVMTMVALMSEAQAQGMTPASDTAMDAAALAKVNAYLDAMDESLTQQSALRGVKLTYQQMGVDVTGIQTSYVLSTGVKMLLLALLSALAAVGVGFLGSRISASLGRELRGRVFRQVTAFATGDMERFSTASLITRTTNDVQQVQGMLVMLVRTVFYAPIIGVGGIVKALDANSGMAWVIVLGVGLILAVVVTLYLTTMPRFRRLQELLDRLNLVTREILTGLPVIRAFSTQKKEEQRFDEASSALTRTQLFVNRMMSGMMPLMMIIMNGITVLILWTGAHGVDAGAMQVGSIMAFIQYTMQIIMAFLMISMVSVMLPRAAVAMKRIDEVLTCTPALHSPDAPEALHQADRGEVRFEDVSFRYPGAQEDALRHITFTAFPGQTTAILGGTGCGKSTLAMLIPRLADVSEGRVLVDGVDVRKADLDALRRVIGYVPQKSVLFSGTIRDNVAYADPDMPDSQVRQAAEIAQAASFIEQKPRGYDDDVAQGGTNVSGGQKQRLAIARAVARHPEIYVMDDSFSALDFKTDATLRGALRREMSGATVILIAQRIATVMNADQILVMEDGALVGKGNHKELMASCEAYRQIASSQLSGEELDHAE